jgi:hypothetical protein
LEAEIQELKHLKEDKPVASGEGQVNPNDLTKGNIITKVHTTLTSAGDKQQQLALKIYKFLKSLE